MQMNCCQETQVSHARVINQELLSRSSGHSYKSYYVIMSCYKETQVILQDSEENFCQDAQVTHTKAISNSQESWVIQPKGVDKEHLSKSSGRTMNGCEGVQVTRTRAINHEPL